MPKPTFDRIDRRILQVLQREGRISNAELAARVNLSPSPCLRRVQRLEQSGVIAGYAAQVDPHAVGLGLAAIVRVQLSNHSSDAVARFAESVRGWNEVVACYALTGDMDYLMEIQVEDLDHFSAFVMGKLLNATGVGDMNSSFVLQTVKKTRALPLDHLDPAAAKGRRPRPKVRTRGL
jgi:Lrp/AsnC family leucine-responsive transcriptional regulator